MEKDKSVTGIETPAGDYNGSNKPGDALKLPTKHYPSSGNLGKGEGKTTIEGPCDDYARGYHK